MGNPKKKIKKICFIIKSKVKKQKQGVLPFRKVV